MQDPIKEQIDKDIHSLKVNQNKLMDICNSMLNNDTSIDNSIESIKSLIEEGDSLIKRIQLNSKQE